MKRKFFFILALALWALSCRTYDITSLIFQDDLKRQIASGNLRIKIDEDQIPYVTDLLLDEDPLIRLAALKIINRNRHDQFLYPLLETTLDEDDRVAAEAFRMLVDLPSWTTQFLETELDKMGDLLCLKSLEALLIIDRETSIDPIINLFSVESEKKKDGAARALAQLISLDSQIMADLKSNPDDAMRAGYYRIIGHYNEETLIPLLFEGISDGSTLVWGACVSGIYSFGEAAFPFVDRYIQNDDYLMVLSCLQILEAVKSEKSLPLLVAMLDNPSQLLAQKSAIIVKSYGDLALPYLHDSFGFDNPQANRLILWTLREINSPGSLPFYLKLLEKGDDEYRDDLLRSLTFMGEDIFADLRQAIRVSSPEVASELLGVLLRGGDTQIVNDNICSYYLISATGDEEFELYFQNTDLRSDVKEDFLNLRRALSLGELLGNNSGGDNRYFASYKDSLILRSKAQEALENSLALKRHYFQQGDEEILSQSDTLFSEFEYYDRLADGTEEYMKSLPAAEQKRGDDLIFAYLAARQEVVDIWVGISPRFRPLAEIVYGDIDRNIDLLLEEVSR